MLGALPVSVDPVRLADQSARLRGIVPVARMTRLAGLCGSDTGEAEVELEFRHEAESGLRRIVGHIGVVLDCRCERCLERFRLPLETGVDLRIAKSGESRFTDDSEVLEVSGPVSVAELVENELILALPMVPMHPEEECPATALIGGTTDEEPATTRRENPFAALAALRDKDSEK